MYQVKEILNPCLKSVKSQGILCFRINKAILFLNFSEPSLFLLSGGQNNHPAWSVKIALQSGKSQGLCFTLVSGNLA